MTKMPRAQGPNPAARAILLMVAFLLSSLCVLALLSTSACTGWRFDSSRPDLVLVVVDTLRADHLGVYGYERPTSPRLDALGRSGDVFEAAWASAPWTLPSMMSIMTSRHPSNHRVENDGLKLAQDIPVLAESLGTSGYITGGFVSHIYASRTYEFDRGFDAFEDFGLSEPGYVLEAGLEPTADQVTDAALDWLKAQGRSPVFLFVHYFDPHWPYEPPARIASQFPNSYDGPLDSSYDSISKFQSPSVSLPADYAQFLNDRYDGEIRFVDEQIERLLDGLIEAGRGDRAWIIVTADHGEEFKDHGSMGHGRHLYEEVVRVPLIVARMQHAGSRAGGNGGIGEPESGRRITTPVSGIDLFPTLLDLAGVGAPTPPGIQGRSFAPLLLGGQGAELEESLRGRVLVSETIRLNSYKKAIRLDAMKLIRFVNENRTELYDLVADPREKEDLSATRPELRRDLLRELFSTVDLLSGAWNLTWTSDGIGRRFQGQVRTTGSFRSIVPLFQEEGKYVIERGNTLSFTDHDQTADSGITFTTVPYDAPVTFYFMVDGDAAMDHVYLGGRRAHPREMPFTLEGDPTSEAAFVRPPLEAGVDVGFCLWRTRRAGSDQGVALDERLRERLESLGYVD